MKILFILVQNYGFASSKNKMKRESLVFKLSGKLFKLLSFSVSLDKVCYS